MSFPVIDPARCLGEGACVAECPFGLLAMNDQHVAQAAKPDQAWSGCIDCGHCLAVCPGQAISLPPDGPEDCPSLNPEGWPAAGQVEALMRGRRSVRTYRRRPVPRETIEALLDLTRWAPSAKHTQPAQWLVVDDPAKIKELAGLGVDWLAANGRLPQGPALWAAGQDPVLRHAPCLIIGHASDTAPRPLEDTVIPTAWLELAAAARGLGVCWAGFFMSAAQNHEAIKQRLDLPAGHQVRTALMLGYPRHHYRRVPPRPALRARWL